MNAQVSKVNSTQGTVFSTGPNHISRTFTYVGGDFTACTGLTEVEISISLTLGSDASGSCSPALGGYAVHEDMNLRLVSPLGTNVDLVQDKWGYWTGTNPQPNTLSSFALCEGTVLFDDDAGVTISGDYCTNSVVRPHNALNAFDGENPVGVWTLHISDGNGLFSANDYICFAQATLTVTCGLPPGPEIDILGNGTSIIDGDVTPSVADDTEFGTTAVPVVKTYTIDNSAGAADLNVTTIVSSGTNAADFVVGVITLPAMISTGGSTTFTVTFTPLTVGLKSATITVNNNDTDEATYDFAIQGTGDVTLGTDDFDLLNGEMRFYPNPNNGEFTLSYSGNASLKELAVFDIRGKIVQTVSLKDFNTSKAINLNGFAKGIYFVKIVSDNGAITKKVIVEY